MPNYREMYLHLFHASEKALYTLLDAKEDCRELHSIRDKYFALAFAMEKAGKTIISAHLECEDIYVTSGGQDEDDEKQEDND